MADTKKIRDLTGVFDSEKKKHQLHDQNKMIERNLIKQKSI